MARSRPLGRHCRFHFVSHPHKLTSYKDQKPSDKPATFKFFRVRATYIPGSQRAANPKLQDRTKKKKQPRNYWWWWFIVLPRAFRRSLWPLLMGEALHVLLIVLIFSPSSCCLLGSYLLFYLLVAVHYCSSLAVSFIYFIVCFIACGSPSNLPTVILPFFSSSASASQKLLVYLSEAARKQKRNRAGLIDKSA